ncbi:MAG: nitrogenase component 1, partial [Treponema sp.]|nr:nitrogenase component 1 [Treponema sp.]
AKPDRVLGKDASQATLHYCSPAHGGWGVVRVALLVPEAQLLFVCPPACGRHGAIAAIEQGYKKKISYLCLNDNEIVLGCYEEEIKRGVREVMNRTRPRPKALMIFMSCIDDLLGTDHTAAIRQMEEEQGVPIRLARMNPISLDNKLPPGIRVQKTMYEFLEPPAKKDRGIIILGSYRPPEQDSELAGVLGLFGFGPIRHPEYCPDFESFRRTSQSAAALLLRPEGRAAAEDLRARLDIPCNNSFMAFDKDTVMERYRGLFDFLENLEAPEKTTGPGAREEAETFLAAAKERAEAKEEQARSVLGGVRLAVDSTATIAPFNLALALVKAGVNVSRIYANQLPAFEKPSLPELARLKGDITVVNPNHARKHGPRPMTPLADMAVGFEAGYAAAAPVTVPLAFDEQLFGFEGYGRVLDALIRAAGEGTSDLRRQVREYGLVV